MNVIFTCGGTGGHINPAIAVANIWRERHPEDKILFIGGRNHMEEELVPRAGYEIVTFPAAAVDREFSWPALKQNALAFKRIVTGLFGCMKVIRDFKPHVMIGTGGYTSFMPLLAAKLCGVPTCVNEANALPGLANRMAAKFLFNRELKLHICLKNRNLAILPLLKRQFLLISAMMKKTADIWQIFGSTN